MGLVLTVGVPPAHAAGWIEGFLDGGGLLLVHDDRLFRLVDRWLAEIPTESFVAVLPLLRRAFSGFSVPERRAIGERAHAADRGGPAAVGEPDEEFDRTRAVLVAPTIALLLGTARAAERSVEAVP
jgi:hypothetical protein